jgi:hypothetical protein
MKITRRAFNKLSVRGLMIAVVGSSLTMTGCNVIQDLIDYIPWIVRALNAITSALGDFMPPQAAMILAVIKGALADIQAACVEYQADPLVTDKSTLLAKIETFLKDLGNNFQQFLNALSAAGPVLSIVVGIIQVVLSTIGWFANQLAQKTGRAMAMQMPLSLRAGNQMIFIVATKRSIPQFKKDINLVVYTNGHPELQMY